MSDRSVVSSQRGVPGDLRCSISDHATIARFVVDHEKAIERNRRVERIRAEVARVRAEAVATDATEDNTEALLVLDEFLVALSSSKRRLVRLETAPARIEGEDQAAKSDAEARASIGPRCGRAGHKLRGAKSKTLTSRRPRPRSSTLRHPAGRPQST